MPDLTERSIIRVKKSDNPYAVIDKYFLTDKRLSWKAKGILTYFLSKPDNWKIYLTDLVNQSTDGKNSVSAGLQELKQYGYLIQRKIREKGKIIGWESIIYERPATQVCNTTCITETSFSEVCNTSCNTQKPNIEACNTTCNTEITNLDICNTSCNTIEKDLIKPHPENQDMAKGAKNTPHPDFPLLEKPELENRTLLNNDLTNDFDLNKKEDAHRIAVELQRHLSLDLDLAISMAVAGLKKHPIDEFLIDQRILKFAERYKNELRKSCVVESPEGFFVKTFELFVSDKAKKDRWRKQNFQLAQRIRKTY